MNMQQKYKHFLRRISAILVCLSNSLLILSVPAFSKNNTIELTQEISLLNTKCPANIIPAYDKHTLVRNMVLFTLNGINKDRYYYNEQNIKCYFNGEIKWVINDNFNKYYSFYPSKWGKDHEVIYSIYINNVISDRLFKLEVYYVSNSNNIDSTIILYGKNEKFNPLPILQKYFFGMNNLSIKFSSPLNRNVSPNLLDEPSSFFIRKENFLGGNRHISFDFLKYNNDGGQKNREMGYFLKLAISSYAKNKLSY